MLRKNAAIRVVFNDAHANLPSNSYIPQGGVASFARKFCNYFNGKSPEVELISLLFSDNTKNNDIYIKETMGHHKYYELFYPRIKLTKSYKKEYTKKEYTKLLEPLLKQIDIVFETIKPNIVFLNGFSLSNWMILETAYRKKYQYVFNMRVFGKKKYQLQLGPSLLLLKKYLIAMKKIFSKNLQVKYS